MLHFLLILALTCFCGGVFIRLRGMNNTFPPPVLEMLYCVIYLLVMQFFEVSRMEMAAAYAAAVGFLCSGHGQWQSLNKWLKYTKPEKLDFIVRIFFGRDPRTMFKGWSDKMIEDECLKYGLTKLYWRGVFGMAVSGMAVSLFPGLAVMHAGFPLYGAILALSGALKGWAALIGWEVNGNTEGGEWRNGIYCFGACWLLVEAFKAFSG